MRLPHRRPEARHGRRSGLLTTTLAAALCLGVLNGAPGRVDLAGAAAVPVAPTWLSVWRDDFTGAAGSLPATASWLLDTGRGYPGGPDRWGTGEQETFTADPANVSLNGLGQLRLTATRNPAGAWSSGRIETRRADFRPPAGGQLRIEARVQLPAGGQGYWPAFWALGAPYRTHSVTRPATGEIDLMENINNDKLVHGTLHRGEVEVGGPRTEGTGLTGAYPLASAAGASGYHTYGLVWTDRPGRLDWYVDGHRYLSVDAASTGTSTWTSTVNHGYFLLLDLAVGGRWPGVPGASTRSGQSMLVDYLAVSRCLGTSPVAGSVRGP